jgi:hypothetical protein
MEACFTFPINIALPRQVKHDFSAATAFPAAPNWSLLITTPGMPRLRIPSPLALRARRRFIWNSSILNLVLFHMKMD